MSILSRLKKALAPPLKPSMIGKVMMDVQLDGCMAHIATIKRVGEVIAVATHEELWGRPVIGGIPGRTYEYAVCRVIRPEFSQDTDVEETFNVPLADNWLVPMPGGGGYVWRH